MKCLTNGFWCKNARSTLVSVVSGRLAAADLTISLFTHTVWIPCSVYANKSYPPAAPIGALRTSKPAGMHRHNQSNVRTRKRLHTQDHRHIHTDKSHTLTWDLILVLPYHGNTWLCLLGEKKKQNNSILSCDASAFMTSGQIVFIM